MSVGWLLDVYAGSDGASLVVWIRTPEGGTIRRSVPYAAPFYIQPTTKPLAPAMEMLEADGRVRATWSTQRRLSLHTPPQPVLAVLPDRFVDARGIATDLQKALGSASYHYYDADLEAPSRWMRERGIFPFCRLAREAPDWKSDDARYALDYEPPPLRSANLSVERDPSTGHIGAIEFAGERLDAHGQERGALLELGRMVDSKDPDFILTHGGDAEDLPLLMARIDAHRLRARVRLGRDPDPRGATQQERSQPHEMRTRACAAANNVIVDRQGQHSAVGDVIIESRHNAVTTRRAIIHADPIANAQFMRKEWVAVWRSAIKIGPRYYFIEALVQRPCAGQRRGKCRHIHLRTLPSQVHEIVC